MKKTILSLVLVASTAAVANAQTTSFGVKAGASLTNIVGKGTDGLNLKNKFGFNGGFIANFGFNDAFSVQPEVLYSMKGTKEAENYYGKETTIKSTLHYIDVPVLAHINAGGLFFELGPQIGFLVAAKQQQDDRGSYDIKSKVKKVDFGYAAGLGYQMPAGPGIGLRYNGGLVDTNKNSNSNYAVRNSAFQLYLTYMFGGK